jgi:peptidoglycan-associated lipoprotein
MKHANVCTLLTLAATLLAGCSATPVAAPAPAPAPVSAPVRMSAPAAPAGVPAAVGAPNASMTTSVPAYLDPNNPISTERSVYFDFDDYKLKSQYAALIERHAKYLAATPALAIKIEGNADERGSAEYNVALGQRRAESVMKALKILGTRDTQMEAISWGEERPRTHGHDETAWAQNRRADLVYPAR